MRKMDSQVKITNLAFINTNFFVSTKFENSQVVRNIYEIKICTRKGYFYKYVKGFKLIIQIRRGGVGGEVLSFFSIFLKVHIITDDRKTQNFY